MHFQPGRPPCGGPPRAVALAVGCSTRCAKKSEQEVRRDRSSVSPRRSTLDLTKNCREKLTFDLWENPGFCRMACKTYFAAPAARKRARESPSLFPDLAQVKVASGQWQVASLPRRRKPSRRPQGFGRKAPRRPVERTRSANGALSRPGRTGRSEYPLR
jgi:hypothetical protein